VSNAVRDFVSLPSATAGRNGAGFYPCQGLYYRPDASATPTTAFIATHYNVDFSEHYLAEHLAERGFGFLGWNTRFRGNEAFFLLEHALVDIAAGVTWLKTVAGVERVILLGNSGGGSLMAAYQSQACEVDIQPAFGMKLPDALGELPRADAYVSLCAHRGRPEVLTDWMDPAVVSETDPVPTDAALDMFDPHNGPPYDEGFLKRYRAAQVQRNERISSWAVAELERLQAAGLGDRVFVLHRVWADLRFMDPEIDPSERPTGRCYAGDPKRANFSAPGLGVASTLRTWLAMWSLSHSSCRGELHLPKITCPTLVVQADADCGVFPSEARAIVAAVGSSEKRLEVISGDHYLAAPDSARSESADLICNWLTGLSW
jgi:pimeloyl-ACP methyl ester carboxylesterase